MSFFMEIFWETLFVDNECDLKSNWNVYIWQDSVFVSLFLRWEWGNIDKGKRLLGKAGRDLWRAFAELADNFQHSVTICMVNQDNQ